MVQRRTINAALDAHGMISDTDDIVAGLSEKHQAFHLTPKGVGVQAGIQLTEGNPLGSDEPYGLAGMNLILGADRDAASILHPKISLTISTESSAEEECLANEAGDVFRRL